MPVDRPLGPADPRAADRDAQRLARGHRRADGCLHRIRVGHVRQGEGAADLVGDLLARLLVKVGDDDLRPCLGQHARGGLTEAAGAAGDDRGSSVKLHEPEHTMSARSG
jgi:hypothetical protein